MPDASLVREHIRRMSGYQPGEQPRGADIIKLNTNENPYPPSPRVGEVLRSFDFADLRRYPDPACLRLREALALRHGCALDNVFVGNGSDEVLALFTRAFVEEDGTIAFFEPSYSLYPVLAAIRGVATSAIPLEDDFSWDPAAVGRASLLFLAHPHAPSGRGQSRARVEALVERFPGVVAIDEAYADFASDSFVDLATRGRNVLVARSFSKSFSLAGLRVGYAIGPSELIAALFAIKDSYNVDTLAQTLARTAVEEAEWMEQNVRRVVQTRRRLRKALGALGWDGVASEANFVWMRPPRKGPDARAMFERLRTHRIYVRWFPGPRTGDFLRITVGTDAEIDALLDVLKREADV